MASGDKSQVWLWIGSGELGEKTEEEALSLGVSRREQNKCVPCVLGLSFLPRPFSPPQGVQLSTSYDTINIIASRKRGEGGGWEAE